MHITNTIEQEEQDRHSGLFAEFLAQMYKHSDPFGNQWVEVISSVELRLHTRYTVIGRTYEITQTMILDTHSATVHESPSP